MVVGTWLTAGFGCVYLLRAALVACVVHHATESTALRELHAPRVGLMEEGVGDESGIVLATVNRVEKAGVATVVSDSQAA